MPWDRAGRVGIDIPVRVGAAPGTTRRTALDVAVHSRFIESRACTFLVFQSPLFLGSIDFVEISDAGIALGRAAGFNEIWDGDSGQKANDRHDNHDFDQRKTGGLSSTDTHTIASLEQVLLTVTIQTSIPDASQIREHRRE